MARHGYCRRKRLDTHPRDEALVGAVHRLPAGDELEEEDAEGEHVRLLVHDAVREVLRRQAPVITYVQRRWRVSVSSSPACIALFSQSPMKRTEEGT